MPRGLIHTLLLLATVLAATAMSAPRPEGLPPEIPWPVVPALRFQRGDDPSWAARDFDDARWREVSWGGLPSRDGVYWDRATGVMA